MKYVSLIFKIIILALAFALVLELNSLFFKSTQKDDLALLITLGFSLLGSWLFKTSQLKWVLVIFTTILPLALYPLTILLVETTNWGLLALHVFLVVMTFGLMNLKQVGFLVLPAIGILMTFFVPKSASADQKSFYDLVERTYETRKGIGHDLKWKGGTWRYYNRQLMSTTVDRHIWQEAYVQPVMQFIKPGASVLLIGGESGLLTEELRKFETELKILPYDQEFHLRSELKTKDFLIESENIGGSMEVLEEVFDLIVLDLPDPIDVEFGQYYSTEFFELCRTRLSSDGFLVTHSGDLYSKSSSREMILTNAFKADFHLISYHAQIPTIGQWSWFIAAQDSIDLNKELLNIKAKTETKWWNQEAMDMMLSFGKSEILSKR